MPSPPVGDSDLQESVKNYFNKTIKYIHNTIEFQDLKKDMPLILFDTDYLRKLEEKAKSKEEKAANIVFTLNKLVLVDRYKTLMYEALSDKVERILKMWRDKNKDYERICKEGIKLIEEINALSARQKELGLSDLEYSILLI